VAFITAIYIFGTNYDIKVIIKTKLFIRLT